MIFQVCYNKKRQWILVIKRKLVIPSAVYLFLYVFGIVMMFMNEHSATAYIAPTGVGIVGAIGLIRYALPEYIKKFKEKKLLERDMH